MIIKNGYVIDPGTNLYTKADIRLEDGVIKEVGILSSQDGEEMIDAAGLVTAPGLIDTHVHFRDPGFPEKETIHTGALAAAAGGFTSCVCMANTSPVVDCLSVLQDIRRRAAQEDIHVYQTASVTMELAGEELTDMEALSAAGAVGFTDDGIPLLNPNLCHQAMKRAAALDVPISLHEEDPAFITTRGVNEGAVSARMGLVGASALAEEIMVARDCMLAVDTGAKVVIQHVSSGRSVTLIRNAKRMGADIHAEATPHHFSLTEDAVLEYGTMAKMNPPLRTEADREAILEGLADGTIDLIATDHAPHTAREKEKPFPAAPSGIIGLETALALGITHLVNPGILSLPQLLEKMSTNPANLYRIPGGKIQTGLPADLVIFDPKEEWTPTHFVSLSANSPFLGQKLCGRVRYTICRGEVI